MGDILNNVNILHKALEGLWLRNKAISHNISNADTPNYKRLEVRFEDRLRDALNNRSIKLETTHDKHISSAENIHQVRPTVEVDRSFAYRFDGNNVNIDVEAANLAKNAIMYNAVVNQVSGEFSKLRNVISEGSR